MVSQGFIQLWILSIWQRLERKTLKNSILGKAWKQPFNRPLARHCLGCSKLILSITLMSPHRLGSDPSTLPRRRLRLQRPVNVPESRWQGSGNAESRPQKWFQLPLQITSPHPESPIRCLNTPKSAALRERWKMQLQWLLIAHRFRIFDSPPC